MPEIAILRKVRELQERQQMTRARRRSDENMALALGRVIFGGYFLYSGLNHFLNREMLTGYAASKGTPMLEAAVTGSGAMLVLGGLSLITGVRPKLGASLIGAFLLGVTPKMHDFWRVEDAQQRMGEQVNFLKNLALLGGAAFAAAMPEPWS